MKILIKFLVYELKTIDGNRGSANQILSKINQNKNRRKTMQLEYELF